MRKWILIFLAALGTLLLLPMLLLAVLLHTETGTNLLAGQLTRLERYGVRIENLSGTIAGGLRVARFELEHPRVHIVSHDIIAQLEVSRLVLQTISVSSLTARDTLVEIRAAEMPESTRPPRFLPRFIRIDARSIDLARVRYVNINGATVDADRIRASGRLSSSDIEVRDVRADAASFNATAEVELHAARPLELSGKVNGRIRPENAPEIALDGEVSGDLDRLAIKATARTPSIASIDVVYTHPEDRWRIEGQLTSPAFAFDPWMERPPFSLRDVALHVEAMDTEIRAAGKLGVPEFDDADLTIDARGRYAERVLRIAAAELALSGTPARLHAAGAATFDGGPPSLDVQASWTNLQWPLRDAAIVESATGRLHLRGPLPYDFDLEATASGPQIPLTQGSASGVLARDQLVINTYTLAALQGSFTGAATLAFAEPRAWTLTANAENVDPSELHAEFPGRISFSATGKGTGLDKKARFSLTVPRLAGTLRNLPLRGSGAGERDARGFRIRDARLALGDARVALDATVRDTVDARWSVNVRSMKELLPEANGSFNSSGSASGPVRTPHIVATVDGKDLQYGSWTASQLSIDGDVDLAGQKASRLTVRGAKLGYGSPLLGSLNIDGKGNAEAHRLAIALSGIANEPGSTAPRAEIEATGRVQSGTWFATVNTTHIITEATQERLEIAEPAQVVVARDRASLDALCLTVSKGRLCTSGRWERAGPWEGIVSGYEIPLATVLPSPGEDANYEGRIEGRVRAFGTPGKPWEAEAGMRIIDAAIVNRPQGAEPETLQLGNGGLAANATPERITFSLGVQAFQDTFLYANARIERNGSNDVLNLPLTGDIRARAADANLLPLVFPEVDHAAGLLTASADIYGTLAKPDVRGRVELANGELDSYRVNLSLRELGLVADFTSADLGFRGAARAGDGHLNADGRFTWMGDVARGDLTLKGENLLVADLPQFRIVASPDLQFRIEGQRMDVTGSVLIPTARIQPVELSGAVRASEDVRFVGEHPAEAAGRFIVHSNVRVAMGEDVRLDTFGLQGRISGAVAVDSTTGETPVGRGELQVLDGRYEAYGQKLEISRGRLLFDASPVDDPGLDIEARREIEAVEVGMNVRGTLQEPRITFFSDPSMPQTEILAYMLIGKSLGNAQSGEAAKVASASDALAMQGGGLLASRFGRRLGLDEIGVESSTSDSGESNQSLVLGKFLSPRLYVSYGISLTESINTLKVRYTILSNLLLKSESGENQSADLEYTIER